MITRSKKIISERRLTCGAVFASEGDIYTEKKGDENIGCREKGGCIVDEGACDQCRTDHNLRVHVVAVVRKGEYTLFGPEVFCTQRTFPLLRQEPRLSNAYAA